ncbi:hypothetical protein BDY19DRAFT_887897 [Irpex rosettiformis]|uniref:Uncharacterized protein n=1 Tax=Irpex rosettiformis TaxID=378272 RepID=A0ACB8U7J4_9APHY|nr:hypothetical protein BDY19DRAFT_887897 [Irpex rosettiformis]
MSNPLAVKFGRKLFSKHLKQYQPADPLYETYVDKKGRERRRKRELPPGLSARDAKILKSVKKRAHYLDKGFNICGLRFGWTFIIGIIPGAGDVADATLNYVLIVRKARQAELPSWLISKMLANNAVSAAVGFVPIVGDIVLAAFKANSRNAALLEEYLRIRGEEFLKLEAERAENPENVKPGAGREAHVPGNEAGQSSGGWFRRLSRGSNKSGKKSKDLSPTPSNAAAGPARRESRFVEDVPEKVWPVKE